MRSSGFEDFKKILAGFKYLSTWVAGISLVTPFVTASLDVIPPWPKKLAAITAVVELITLIAAYRKLSGKPR